MAFEKAGYTAAELIRCAKHAGVAYEICYVEPTETTLEEVREGLFQGPALPNQTLADRLKLRCCENIFDECRVAANEVMQLIRKGYRYRDISVVCTDMAAYRDMIALIFHRCNIPIYLSGTEEILEKSVISTVLGAMDAALGGFAREAVLRYLKSVLSPLDADAADMLENYSILWGIQGNRWLSPWTNHPEGLGEAWNDHVTEKLDRLNTYRELAMQPLIKLRDGFKKATILRHQVSALYDFFEEIRLAQRMKELADTLDKKGDNRSAQILNQLWEILLSAMEQLYDVLGDTVWDSATFTRLFSLLLSQYDVGTIPPVLDAVTVGPVNAMRCHQVEHLLVLGAQEGQLPGYGGSAGVLTDKERVALREMGVPLTGGSMEGIQAEFAEIYGVFCGARSTVTVSYSEGQPSYVYRRLLQMSAQDNDRIVQPQILDALEATASLVRMGKEDAANQLALERIYRDIASRSAFTLGKISYENISALYGKKLRLSASQVDRQSECKFSYFMKYGMRAKERREAEVDPAEFGTYVHAVLENTARDVMALGGFHQVTLGQTVEIALAHSKSYAQERFSELDSQRAAYLFQRNVQELEMVVKELWEELSASAFAPVDFEVAFGDGQQMPAIDIPGGKMEAQLRGFVDRVDAWNNGYTNYFRVVDYKTGRKDFDYCDVFNGLNLQMLLYLFALEKHGQNLLGEHPVPVGVQYFPARVPLVSADGRLTEEQVKTERGKGMKRRGLVLSDNAVLDAMEPEGAPKRLSCKHSKDGTVTGDVADREQLKLLERYVFHTLRKIVDNIASGDITPNPYTRGTAHDACAYCPYQAACHFATVEGRRNYKAMSAQQFWDAIGKEMMGDG